MELKALGHLRRGLDQLCAKCHLDKPREFSRSGKGSAGLQSLAVMGVLDLGNALLDEFLWVRWRVQPHPSAMRYRQLTWLGLTTQDRQYWSAGSNFLLFHNMSMRATILTVKF
eukprot:4082257-Amphidinium_carterae.1